MFIREMEEFNNHTNQGTGNDQKEDSINEASTFQLELDPYFQQVPYIE